ncbi:MAG: S-layer homology domain-containing protein [Syntrophales bacterium]|nr:S-layer homology domain-containing protein [Syntrophales bacterium]
MILFSKYRRYFICMAFIAAVLLVVSCGPKALKPTSEMDTPEHHFFTGMKFLEQSQYPSAQAEFGRAIELAPKFSRAYAGLGLVKAYQGDFKAAFEQMEKAWDYAKSKEEKVFVHIGYMRVNTLSKATCAKIGTDCEQDSSWLDKTKGEFKNAIDLDPKSSAAYYYMGMAYKVALDFVKAGEMFTKVLELKGDLTNEADIQWKIVQDIQRAMPGTITGKKIALLEKISRADAAALFMEELKIDVLYKKRTLKTFDTSFKTPEKSKEEAAKAPITASDIAGNPLKADIEGILRLGVRGLENNPDGTFGPNEFVNRATYAMMIEDILIKVSGDNSLATKYIGTTSTFPDLRSDLPYFNAVMVVTSRGVMQAKSLSTGEFAPMDTVSGAEALLIIKKFREELKF